MSLRYTKIGAEQYVKALGTHTLNGSAQNIHVINFTAFGTIERAALVLSDADLTGNLTVLVRGNTAADGSGTDTTILTQVLATADADMVVEIDAELIAHFEDRNGGVGTFKSLVFEVTGTNTDTVEAAVIVKGHHNYQDQTPSDTTTVS
jgi:hypothetical protein